MNDNLINVELLKLLTENGRIAVDTIATQLKEMESRQKYLEMHDHDIWLANDGYWKTKIKESDGKKRLIKKKNKSDLEDAIVEHYERLSLNDNSFKTRFSIWIERQKDCGNGDFHSYFRRALGSYFFILRRY